MTALVVGLGRSAVALAGHLRSMGEEVVVCDAQPAAAVSAYLAQLPGGVTVRLGTDGLDLLEGVDVVYASPGVRWDAPLLAEARRCGLAVSSEMDLFFDLCPAPIVGITGTNGKTTTTALTGSILARGPRPVLVGGNIGATVLDRLREVTPEHWVVLELSSFQLESVRLPRAEIGVVLNITPDHLDRHGTLEAYTDAKARLVEALEPTASAVLNGGDPAVRALAERTRAQVVWFDRHRPLPPMPMPGAHNLQNALAAAAVGRLAGLDDVTIEAAVASFKGVEHRLELVGEWRGTRWYNDSKATNPEAALVALNAFSEGPLVLIAGGQASSFELGEWLAAIQRRAGAVVLIGESASILEKELAGHAAVHRAGDLDAAVEIAARLAQPGGVVLLSPGYKSFDWFRSYEDRGTRFKSAVRSRMGA